jgi:hypothetical protein
MYFAYGIGGIVALFLLEFEGKTGGTDDKLWVVTGDLPSAYMVVESDESPRKVLERYCELMDDWVSALRRGGDFRNVYPVPAARTKEHADMLEQRLAFLRKEVIPEVPANFVTDSNGELVT